MNSSKSKTHRRKNTNEDLKVLNQSNNSYEILADEHSKYDDHLSPKPSCLSGDYLNIGLLLFLYILQGIPLGLIASVPYILSNSGVTYSQQAIFSFVTWPFSLKLLWAPVVDSLYFERFGRRKSWLVPIQYMIGIFMMGISYHIETMMGNPEGPNMILLTFIFLALNFLAATQDIAVDGWALTMLKPSNVGYASTCNSVGQTAGYFLGNIVFLTLESVDFANSYIRSTPKPYGLVDLPGFFYFWGIIFLITTTVIMVFKREANNSRETENMTIRQTYSKLIKIFNLSTIRRFTFILLTCKIGFAVTDSATGLKLIEAGVHKENLALLAIPLVPLQIILPWIISRYTNGPKPLNIFIKSYPFRLLFGPIFALLLWWTRYLKGSIGHFPYYYYLVIVVLYGLHQIAVYSMFVSIMSFHAKISDPRIGGTYMTFLNTITNLGGNWPATLSLWFIDRLTFTSCSIDGSQCKINSENDSCTTNNGTCDIAMDGYYLETFLCILIGFFWFLWGKKQIAQLQNKSQSAWRTT